MADTTSIASRMEKLAKLKRMKKGLSATAASESEPIPAPAPAAQAATSEPTAELQAEFPAVSEPSVEEHAVESTGTLLDETARAEEEPSSEDPTDPVTEADAPSPDDERFESIFGGAAAELDEPLDPVAETAEDELDTAIPADLLDEPEEDTVPEAEEAEDEPVDTPEPESVETSEEEAEADSTDNSAGFSAEDLGIDDDTLGALDELATLAGVDRAVDEAVEEQPIPDFAAREIDPELLEAEFSKDTGTDPVLVDDPAESEPLAASVATQDEDGSVTVTFDESRSTLLNHVSRQMNCDVEDVVVTALDWYLDALFGEDGEAKTG